MGAKAGAGRADTVQKPAVRLSVNGPWLFEEHCLPARLPARSTNLISLLDGCNRAVVFWLPTSGLLDLVTPPAGGRGASSQNLCFVWLLRGEEFPGSRAALRAALIVLAVLPGQIKEYKFSRRLPAF